MNTSLRMVVLASLIAAAPLCSAAPYDYGTSANPSRGYAATVGEKFGSGVANMATGWVEIPKTMYTSSVKDGLLSGLTLGFFKGMLNTMGRSALGASDMFTALIPTKPMITPPLIWQDFSTETTYNSTWEMYDTH